MTATRLRDAATKLREVAEAAAPGRWYADSDYGTVTAEPFTSARLAYERPHGEGDPWVIPEALGGGAHSDNLAYIATMSPPVALALAVLLDGTRERHLTVEHPQVGVKCCLTCNLDLDNPDDGPHCPDLTDALAVADTILRATP